MSYRIIEELQARAGEPQSKIARFDAHQASALEFTPEFREAWHTLRSPAAVVSSGQGAGRFIMTEAHVGAEASRGRSVLLVISASSDRLLRSGFKAEVATPSQALRMDLGKFDSVVFDDAHRVARSEILLVLMRARAARSVAVFGDRHAVQFGGGSNVLSDAVEAGIPHAHLPFLGDTRFKMAAPAAEIACGALPDVGIGGTEGLSHLAVENGDDLAEMLGSMRKEDRYALERVRVVVPSVDTAREMNLAIASAVNGKARDPENPEKPVPGDVVRFRSADVEAGIEAGELGVVTPWMKHMVVTAQGGATFVPLAEADIELGYVVTPDNCRTGDSQTVILFAPAGSEIELDRAAVYSAVNGARTKAVLMGPRHVFEDAVAREPGSPAADMGMRAA